MMLEFCLSNADSPPILQKQWKSNEVISIIGEYGGYFKKKPRNDLEK